MNLQKIQAKITPISVPIYELPEYVCVETKCITQQFAMENNIQVLSKISRSLANKLQDPTIQLYQLKPAINQQIVEHNKFAKEMRNPRRERSVQTHVKTTCDVGVQCQRDLTDEWDLAFEQPAKSTESDENREAKLLSYFSQHTSMFPNGMLECLICGEVANFLQEHQNHMALHFGPRTLCSACGKMVMHQSLIVQHSYSCPARPNAKSRPMINMQCPHLHCNVMINSKRELTKHLSTHLGVNSYYCLQCRKSFSSATQFLVHRMMVAACCKAKYIYLAKNYPELRKKSNPKRCTVCMKQFSSIRNCVWHRRRCILAYQRRLKNLLNPLCRDNEMQLA